MGATRTEATTVRPDAGSGHNDGPRQEIRELFVEYARTRDRSIRDRLTAAHLPLAASLAARYAGRSESAEDLEQTANLALVKAIDRFDPSRGFEFSTYAWATISGELKRHLRDRTWGMRVPRRVQERFLVTARAVDDLHQKLGRPPTVAEVAGATGLDEEATIEALDARAFHRLPSLDAPIRANDGGTQSWEPGAIDGAFEQSEDHDLLQRLIVQLPERDRELLRLRFAEGLTQSEIAHRIGVSQMHVSRRLSQTVERLRHLAATAERADAF
ncbi:MAG TPA: sigma-70 family RNA polymerase sigma factor [Acidimicrobiales bacterium]|nr:sigma-70 family RNA polymerase sigma factor [Acidimicrobiales bacterium]